MDLKDKNQWLQPPENYSLASVTAQGAYLVVAYTRVDAGLGHRIQIYLNTDGREVLRTIEEFESRPVEDSPLVNVSLVGFSKPAEPRPAVARRFRLAAGFWLALEGLKEMVKCLLP